MREKILIYLSPELGTQKINGMNQFTDFEYATVSCIAHHQILTTHTAI